jgi:hypothetical protein
MTIFTGLLLVVTGGQLFIGWRTDAHFQRSERAYVKMSHEPPGIVWDAKNQGWFAVSVKITNHGRTPAQITDIRLGADVITRKNKRPAPPDYGAANLIGGDTQAFLVCADFFYRHGGYSISCAEHADVMAGGSNLFFYGYVDYIDQFGVRHRAGYGRLFDKSDQSANLVFPRRKSLNYDRVRLPSEGNDWT